MLNPMDGHKDIHPWPYTWSREIAGSVISALTFAKALYPNLDFWTYENHWTWATGQDDPLYTSDIYWGDFDDGEERQQLPVPIGDQLSALILDRRGEHIRVMAWMRMLWTPMFGWVDEYPSQLQCASHIHIEWDATSLEGE